MKLNIFFLLSAAALVNSATAIDEVLLGAAENYVILTKTGISTVASSAITGDIGVSPIAATAITGFGLTMHSGGQYSEASQITGKAYAADYGGLTATSLTTAVGDMETAYADASSRPNENPDRIDFEKGVIGGKTLTPGVYTFETDISILSNMYFSGSGVFIIQTTGNLLQAANTRMILKDGAEAKNIFWQITGRSEANAGAHMEGIILVKMDALFKTGSSLNGRVFAQTACDLQMATIVEV
jgi:hypothetical protein